MNKSTLHRWDPNDPDSQLLIDAVVKAVRFGFAHGRVTNDEIEAWFLTLPDAALDVQRQRAAHFIAYLFQHSIALALLRKE